MSDAIEFRVIGELKCDRNHLLLSDEDGRWYDYDISLGTIVTVEPSEFWAVDLADDSRRSFTAPTPQDGIDQGAHTAALVRSVAFHTPPALSGTDVPHALTLW